MSGHATRPLAGLSGARLRVAVAYASSDSGSWSHRRAGFAFDKEPTSIPFEELGAIAPDALDNLILIASDPHLCVTLIAGDGREQVLNDGAGQIDTDAIAAFEVDRSMLRETAH